MTAALQILSGKRVLVTGHTGFVGSWLALWLHSLGAKVFGYSLPPPTEPSNYQLSGVKSLLEQEWLADICDEPLLAQCVEHTAPDAVFHLAAQAIVSVGYQEPRRTLETNIIGTSGLLDCVRRRKGPCAVIVVTSDKCYHNPETLLGLDEDNRMGGKDPYSASKGAAELVVAAYRNSFFPVEEIGRHGVQLAALRAGNIIGGGDWAADRIIPDILRALSLQQAVVLRCPQSIRPWQHVCEPTFGMLLLASKMLADPKPLWSEGWNFGPSADDRVPVSELTDIFLRAWGSGTWKPSGEASMPEARYLLLNSTKAANHLGWRCLLKTETAIERTAQWYKYCQNGTSSREACLRDILDYSRGANGA